MQIAYLRKWGVSKCVTCHDFYSVTTYVTDRWSHCAFFNIHYILHQSSCCAIKYPFNVSSVASYKIWTLFIDRWSHCDSLLFIKFCIKQVSVQLISHFIMVSMVALYQIGILDRLYFDNYKPLCITLEMRNRYAFEY